MEFTSETGRIPKGYGYILKPSFIKNAFHDAGIELAVHLVRSHSKRLFDAHFWPPNLNIPYERLYIKIGTARAPDVMELRQRAELEAIPELVIWVRHIIALDIKSPGRCDRQTIQLL
jgi:hypothetical protein